MCPSQTRIVAIPLIRFFESIDGAEGIVSESGFEAIEVFSDFFDMR